MTGDFGAAVARIAAAMGGRAVPDGPWDGLRAEIDGRHAARMAEWEARRPQRERAEAAYRAAQARRRAELGASPRDPVPVAAAAPWAAPPSSSVFMAAYSCPMKAAIRNEAGVTVVMVYDDVGEDGWFSEGLTAKAFAAQLKGVTGALQVNINSGGGSVFDG